MAKVFQILNAMCYKDYTPMYKSAKHASTFFAPNIKFVDAPDFVFEGWGYDETAEGDERFIKPTPPPGWEYDDETGTFYNPVTIIENQIKVLQEQLNSSDYKIIKSYELSLIGESSPYDIEQVHAERQMLRDAINGLKNDLEEL